MTLVYLSLGSNIGDRKMYLLKAIKKIDNLDNTQVLAISSFYQTKAWGNTNQDDFINCAIAIKTDLDPYILLDHCQEIEKDLDRIRHEHWGPRTIDIDILLYGQLEIKSDNLLIPHPYMYERAFVLVPLLEIMKELQSPLQAKVKKNCQVLDTKEIIKI